MPTDLFQASNIQPTTQSQPVDLLAQSGINPAANQVMQPQTQPTGLAAAAAGFAPINIGASRFGGNITEDVGSILRNLGATNIGNSIFNTGQTMINQAPAVYGQPLPNAIAPNMIENLAQGAPYAVLTRGGGALANIAGAGLYGATQSQTGNAMSGGIGNAAIAGGLSLIPAIGAVAKNIYNAISPEAKMSTLTQALGNGAGLEDNAKSLASDIRQSYQTTLQNSANDYQPIMDQVGNNKVYDQNTTQSNYLSLPKQVTDHYDSDLNDAHNDFLNNPTFSNAKDLSSQLGANIGSLQKGVQRGTIDQAGRNTLSALGKAKNALDGDLGSYLDTQNPTLSAQYNQAKENFMQNVVPYRSDSYIRDIATGKITNPQNVSSIFSNPELSTMKVVGDLPQNSWNKILYDKLGSPSAQRSPENLLNAINNLDKQGLSSYVTPQTQNLIDNLQSSVNAKDTLGHVAGMAAGAMFGSHLGEGSELLGGMLGSKLAPWAIKKTGIPQMAGLIGKAANSAGSLGSQIYKPLLYGGLSGINRSQQ